MTNLKKVRAKEINQMKLLSLLKARGELSFTELHKELGVSKPTLCSYLKPLVKQNMIEFSHKSEPMRKTYYRIKPEYQEQVNEQMFKYEITRFIEGIDNPVSAYEKSSDGKHACACFISVADEGKRKRLEALARDQVNRNMHGIAAKARMMRPLFYSDHENTVVTILWDTVPVR